MFIGIVTDTLGIKKNGSPCENYERYKAHREKQNP
jgi:hypothetical protein